MSIKNKMNIKWKRKSNDDLLLKDFPIEDLFLCNNCSNWYPWFHFCLGAHIVVPNDNNVYALMNDDEDRGERKQSCDYCIEKILYDNNLITITDINGKKINK